MPKKITDHQRERLIVHYIDHGSIQGAAAHAGMSRNTASKHLVAGGLIPAKLERELARYGRSYRCRECGSREIVPV